MTASGEVVADQKELGSGCDGDGDHGEQGSAISDEDITEEKDEVPQLVRLNWRGGLPLLVEAVASEYDVVPLPYYTFASRQSFLPHALAAPISQLRAASVVPSALQRVWFSAGGVILKWQLPLGSLFDVCCGFSGIDNDLRVLPFRIVVHLTPPSDSGLARRVLPCPEASEVKRDFFHWFKQGMFLRFASRLPFTEFRNDDDEVLWSGVAGGSVDQFWGVLRRFKDYEPKALPVRLLIRKVLFSGDVASTGEDGSSNNDGSGAAIEELTCRQHSVPMSEADTTLGEILSTHLLAGVPLADDKTTQQLLDNLGNGSNNKNQSLVLRIVSQGIAVPLDAPIGQLYTRLASPDLFLYLCVL